MGANYSFYVKTIETHAHTFLPLDISAIGTVSGIHLSDCKKMAREFVECLVIKSDRNAWYLLI